MRRPPDWGGRRSLAGAPCFRGGGRAGGEAAYEGRVPIVRFTFFVSPLRTWVSDPLSPACLPPPAVVRSLASRIAVPSNSVTTSPALSPALAAGEPLWTRPIRAPSRVVAVETKTPR